MKPGLILNAGIAAWLSLCLFMFRAHPGQPVRDVLWITVIAAAVSLGLGRLRRLGDSPVVSGCLFGLALGILVGLAGRAGLVSPAPREAAWLGTAAFVLSSVAGLLLTRLESAKRTSEAAIWVGLGLVGTGAMTPFYYAGAVGSGDATWYTMMLADFVQQIRAGQFPIFIGQGVFSFNGGISPLRLAPAFQHAGALLDLLTAGGLEPAALKNATLATAGFLGIFSAYASILPVARGRRGLAAMLATLWIAGPGVIAPVVSGDQYMSFMTVPVVPVIFYGCWRLWEHDDRAARFFIAAGLAATWLCHAPIALWMTGMAGINYVAALFVRRQWGREIRLIPFSVAVGAALGSLPIVSALTLDGQRPPVSTGLQAYGEIKRTFPANFLPLDVSRGGLANYQLGYAIMAVLLLGLVACAISRRRTAVVFAAWALMIAPLTLPVPWISEFVWARMPDWVVGINNVWPMQRLFLIWSAAIVFLLAVATGDGRAWQFRWFRHATSVLTVAGLAWSVHELFAFAQFAIVTRVSVAATRQNLDVNNFQLTRYSYSSYNVVPSNYSHGYREPWLENRLLDPVTLTPTVTNTEAAAPRISSELGSTGHPRLVQSGIFTMEGRDGHLEPSLNLDPGIQYALRFDFFHPNVGGYLQFIQEGIFREYTLPDSGFGMGFNRPPAAFGSMPTSSAVVPLTVAGRRPYLLVPHTVGIAQAPDRIPFARFWLFTYRRAALPIVVESWIPYRVTVETAAPALLETPRMWQRGWRAEVNGRPVPTRESTDGLVAVPLDLGKNRVELRFVAPAILTASFWICAAGWTAIFIASAAGLARARPTEAFR